MLKIDRIDKNSRYSRIVVHAGVAYFSGLTATDANGDIEAQTRSVLEKADAQLATLGRGRSSLLSATVWLRDIADFTRMNTVWEAWIDPDNPPARATVEAKLAAPNLLIEIQFIAAVPSADSDPAQAGRSPPPINAT